MVTKEIFFETLKPTTAFFCHFSHKRKLFEIKKGNCRLLDCKGSHKEHFRFLLPVRLNFINFKVGQTIFSFLIETITHLVRILLVPIVRLIICQLIILLLLLQMLLFIITIH